MRWSRRAAPSREATAGATGCDRRIRPIWNGRGAGQPAAVTRGRIGLTAGRLWDEARTSRSSTGRAACSRPVDSRRRPARRPQWRDGSASTLQLLGALEPIALACEYAAAGIFVSPALYEPFGLAVLEAPGRLRPGAVRHPDVPRAVGRRRGVRPAGDAAALARAHATTCWTIPERGAPLGEAAQNAPARYTPEAMVARHSGMCIAASRAVRSRGLRAPDGIVYFTHSLRSCWNHGNAHFLRGVLRELSARGHDVVAFEPAAAGACTNLLATTARRRSSAFARPIPELADRVRFAGPRSRRRAGRRRPGDRPRMERAGAGRRASAHCGARGARFTLLFHDTHHRAVSDPEAIARLRPLRLRRRAGVRRDAGRGLSALGLGRARVRLARGGRYAAVPSAGRRRSSARGWSGSATGATASAPPSCEDFLLRPAPRPACRSTSTACAIPTEALALLRRYGARYRGWLPNAAAPEVFARHLATVHVPRRFYVDALPGIPTIRVFEALACGIPLVCAPWRDSEGLFPPGEDFLMARDGAEMAPHLMRAVATIAALRRALAARAGDHPRPPHLRPPRRRAAGHRRAHCTVAGGRPRDAAS